MFRPKWTTLLVAAALIASAAPSNAQESGYVKLFNGKDLTGWKTYLDPKGNKTAADVWKTNNGVIECEGSVNGYLVTEKEYGDYVLKLQWRWGDKMARGRNSGVFVHVSGPDKIWPKGAEAQLMANHAGDFWLVDGFKLTVDKARQDPKVDRHYFKMTDKMVEKPLGEWNTYEITCQGDTIKLVVNDQLVNEGKGAEATKGKILLQSEGAEIHFRNIELKPLK